VKRPRAAPGSASDGLCVLFECAPWLCAIPSSWVDGLLTLDEARLLAGAPGKQEAALRRCDPRAPLAGDMRLSVGSHWYAPWDLGQMVELAPLAGGWLLLQIRHAERYVPLALRVGPCTAVHPIAEALPLPRALFRARPAAFDGAFVFDAGADPGQRAPVGLRLDPAGLWTARELDQSARLMASAVPHPERRSHG